MRSFYEANIYFRTITVLHILKTEQPELLCGWKKDFVEKYLDPQIVVKHTVAQYRLFEAELAYQNYIRICFITRFKNSRTSLRAGWIRWAKSRLCSIQATDTTIAFSYSIYIDKAMLSAKMVVLWRTLINIFCSSFWTVFS